MELARLPRFKRLPAIKQLRLTNRDCDILKHVHLHRFLRSDHITSLFPGSPQQVLRRLQLLYHHGYLERPRCQIDYYQSGSRRMAYGIGNKGGWLLKREFSLHYHRLDWQAKNRVSRLFLEHALLVSDVMVAVEMACRNQSSLRLLSPEEIVPPPDTARKREPLRWTVDIGNRLQCGVIPDRVFGFEFTDKSGRRNQSWFFLEADRGTMPIVRSSLDKSSSFRKLSAYEATWSQNLHRTKLGLNRFRVLTVTSNPERIGTMQQAARSLKRGHGLFLFLDAKTLKEEKDFFALRWQTCRDGETVGLLD